MKILAFYLPQYHSIPENDEWWGKGYTEWTAVKNAKPCFHGHHQPKEPLNENYYDLSDETGKVWKEQASLAKQYGVDGFCIYHYWFGINKQLLEKPMEILLKHPEIKINYCICWANETWARNWYGQRLSLRTELKELQKRFGTTMIYITHDQEEAFAMSDRIMRSRIFIDMNNSNRG